MYATNVVGTRNLLEAASQSGGKVEAVLVASSANIYGNAREGALGEDTPPAPVNDYGVTKVATETVASIYRDRLPIIVTRPFNYTGRGQSPNFLIPKIIDHARRGAKTIELGNLDVARDFSDVRTVADAYARLLSTPAATGGTFNLCSGEATSLRTIVDKVRDLSGAELAVEVNPAFVRASEVASLCGRKDRIEQAIGPLRAISLDETLAWMLED
jgi:nucleoside-diphosphate-sugar epimerase